MFQAGRTRTALADADHLANQFGKAWLKHQPTKEGRTDLLEHLPKLEITMTDAVLDAVGQHLAMSPVIDDLDSTQFSCQQAMLPAADPASHPVG